jgi:hypothetical protein
MSDLFVYYGKAKTKYPAMECQCVFCGNTFLVGTRWLKDKKVLACSSECRKAYLAKQREEKRISEQQQWEKESHYCLRCGKLIANKFGSGLFCSRACANSRECSDEKKQKISQTLTQFYTDSLNCERQIRFNSKEFYSKCPKSCVICGQVLPYNKRHRKTFGDACYKKLSSVNAIKNHIGGLTAGCGTYSKHGRYKGFKCDSIYELVFVIYCLDHNIELQRNTCSFTYIFEGKTRKYYPDFYLPQSDELVELKGYKDSRVDLKLQAVRDSGKKIKILYKQDLLSYFEYVGQTYNKKYNPDYNNLEELYDAD